MKKRRLVFIVAAILILSLGTYVTLSFAQDGSGLPDIPDVPEYVLGQKSVPILPKIPVIVDGVRVDPETFAEHYSMADLRFFLDPEIPDVMYAFSTDEGFEDYIKKVEMRGISRKDTEGSRASSYLYSGYNYGGSSDGTTACGGKFTLPGFNDVTSSFFATPSCDYFRIYEHIFNLGRSLSTGGGSGYSDLSIQGFDNITSSTAHWP